MGDRGRGHVDRVIVVIGRSGDRETSSKRERKLVMDIRAGQDRSEALPGQIVEERYGYYRRCQRFRRNGQQCKAPAMKGADRCYKHQEQADIERRRREQFTLPPLVDLRTVQRTIGGWRRH